MSINNNSQHDPIEFLEEFRGKDFTGKWPTLVEMLEITVKRYGNNPCFRQLVSKDLKLNYK